MRKKREKKSQEEVESRSGKRKFKDDTSTKNKTDETTEYQEDAVQETKSKVLRKKAKDTVVVSEYFQNKKGSQEDLQLLSLKQKRRSTGSRKESTSRNGIKDSDEENEFEESSTSYRSPSASKRKSRNQNLVDNTKKKPDRKRKSNDKEQAKPPKRAKKNSRDEPCKKENETTENDCCNSQDTAASGKIDLKETNEQTNGHCANQEKSNKPKQTKARRSRKTASSEPHDTHQESKKPRAKTTNKKAKSEEATASPEIVNKKAKVKTEESSAKAEIASKRGKIITEESTSSSKVAKRPVSVKQAALAKIVDHSDVTSVLLHMEGLTQSAQPSTSGVATEGDDDVMADFGDSDDDDNTGVNHEAESEESEDDWEEVEDHHGNSPKKSQLPLKPVEFTLEAPQKKKRKEFDWKDYLRRKINRFKKEVAMEMHKVHLLCLTARCLYINTMYQDELLQAQAMSVVMVTRELTLTSVQKCTSDQLEKMFTWIRQAFTCNRVDSEGKENLLQLEGVVSCLQSRSVSSHLEFVSVCILLFREIGFNTRLMMSLQPLPFKGTATKTSGKGKAPARKSKSTNKTKSSKAASKPNKTENSSKCSNTKKDNITKPKAAKSDKGKSSKVAAGIKNGEKNVSSSKNRSRRRCSKDLPGDVYKEGAVEEDSGEEYIPSGEDDSSEESNKRGEGKVRPKKDNSETSTEDVEESDSDFEEDSILVRTQALKRKSPASKNKKILSSDSDVSDDSRTKGTDEWVEVYLEREQKWICLDCVSGRLGKPYDVECSATQPVAYVIGVDNDGYIKDVTQRYASQWLTSTRKLRTDADWWSDTLQPYRCTDTRTDKLEDQEIQSSLQKRPLPTSIGDFKSHPLYALERHLLKFEAIYPPSAVPLGYIRGEPVYARECVYTLHSRENWLKEGRCVRLGEEAYKYVKSRPKWNKPKENPEAKDLEIFGIWQTELYIPPPAVDGKVPRNAHGNVEMFLPSMLPGGTVHLREMPGLNKIAKKLDIDCAPAMIGWDHHCGFSHPLMDGWIVCEEHKDILLAAWDEEQEIIREKEAAKREKRVYENWRKMIRGLLIRERLKKTFDLEGDKKDEEAKENKDDKANIPEQSELTPTTSKVKARTVTLDTVRQKATDAQQSWPSNRIKTETTTYQCVVEEL